MRDWTPIENDERWEDEEYYDLVRPNADALARKWSEIHDREEREMFTREWDDNRYDPGEDCPQPNWYEGGENSEEYKKDLFEYEQTIASWNAENKLKQDLIRAQIEFIENALFEIGCRMMRPYEHWNEDEKYMEYMERDR